MIRLESERLLLREWRDSDKYDLYEYAKSPVIGPLAGWKPHDNIEESAFIIEKFIENQDCWAVTLKEGGKVIGSVGLHRESYPEYLSLGYVFGEAYWGKGYATESTGRILEFGFNTVGLDIVSVSHYPHNLRSKRVIEKLGFKYEGTLRKFRKIFNGEIFDLVHYSMTREEWNDNKTQTPPHKV